MTLPRPGPRRAAAGRTSRRTTPRRCPRCCAGRSRSAGNASTGAVPTKPSSAVFRVGNVALPDVAAVLAAGRELVAPREALLLQAAAGGVLPLGLGRQPRARPARSRRARRSRRRARPGGRAAVDRGAGPLRPAQSAPSTCRHHGRLRHARASAGSRRAGARRRRTTSRSARPRSRGRWPRRRRRTARWSPRARRSRTARRAPRRTGPSPSSGKPSGSSAPMRKTPPLDLDHLARVLHPADCAWSAPQRLADRTPAPAVAREQHREVGDDAPEVAERTGHDPGRGAVAGSHESARYSQALHGCRRKDQDHRARRLARAPGGRGAQRGARERAARAPRPSSAARCACPASAAARCRPRWCCSRSAARP